MNEIIVKDRYENGLPKTYQCGDLSFEWTDWVLCEIEWYKGNFRHWCIASSFRGREPKEMTCTILNPTYDDMRDFNSLAGVWYFKPVKVIEEVREYPKQED